MRSKSVPKQRTVNRSTTLNHAVPCEPNTMSFLRDVNKNVLNSANPVETSRYQMVTNDSQCSSTYRNIYHTSVAVVASRQTIDEPSRNDDRPRDVSPLQTSRSEADLRENEALNLCVKDHRRAALEKREFDLTFAVRSSMAAEDSLSGGSSLYRIMTDPTFVEKIRRNKEIAKLTCQYCKRTFFKSNDLQDHLDIRKDQFDRVKCCACDKVFAQKRYLRYHQRCHTDKNKFTCKICSKQYSRMDNLTRHHVYHTNPNKFSCDMCSKSFARKDLMTKHMKCHDAQKIRCDDCGQFFHTPSEFREHRRSYH